jgi:outer membrane protein assembly factor BamB
MFLLPALAGDMLYIGNHEGKLLGIDLKSQKVSWEFQTDASRQNTATLEKPDGSPNYEAVFQEDFYDELVMGVHKMLAMGTFLSSPVVVDRVIYVGSADGYLYALM